LNSPPCKTLKTLERREVKMQRLLLVAFVLLCVLLSSVYCSEYDPHTIAIQGITLANSPYFVNNLTLTIAANASTFSVLTASFDLKFPAMISCGSSSSYSYSEAKLLIPGTFTSAISEIPSDIDALHCAAYNATSGQLIVQTNLSDLGTGKLDQILPIFFDGSRFFPSEFTAPVDREYCITLRSLDPATYGQLVNSSFQSNAVKKRLESSYILSVHLNRNLFGEFSHVEIAAIEMKFSDYSTIPISSKHYHQDGPRTREFVLIQTYGLGNLNDSDSDSIEAGDYLFVNFADLNNFTNSYIVQYLHQNQVIANSTLFRLDWVEAFVTAVPILKVLNNEEVIVQLLESWDYSVGFGENSYSHINLAGFGNSEYWTYVDASAGNGDKDQTSNKRRNIWIAVAVIVVGIILISVLVWDCRRRRRNRQSIDPPAQHYQTL
jgi:hypothetical protein